MICGLIGTIHKLESMRVELNVQGVIYAIAISVQTSAQLRIKLESSLDSSAIHLHTTHIIREDMQALFGFVDTLEQETFERLLKINGVGSKVALAILSTFSAQKFLEIIASKDIKLLQKVPGVGAKSAGKILLDLAGFCAQVLESSKPQAHIASKHDITSALEALGYKASEIAHILPQITTQDTQSAIKEALRLLAR
ncbi:Holliday junction branch migration protein RuvA [Helicobacter canis]|uniref:Holliday junction branch migration protein RuvA n=1 Tax=Helicobacter canis TaxID=29419 RepID=UPI0026F27997|nr:Holliday junction branch migration protein RuvA [Helicobacter canis]